MQQHQTGRKKPLWAVISLDLLALGAALIVFALFHHVIPRAVSPAEARPVSATPAPSAAPALPSPEPAAVEPDGPEESEAPEETEPPDDRSPWAIAFEDHFSEEVVVTDTSYSSPNVSVTVTQYETGEGRNKNTYYVADIYIASIECFRTHLAHNTFGRGIVQNILDMSLESEAIVAITGDMYTYQGASLVLRNGELYRDGHIQTYQTHCVLNHDGTMAVYGANELDLDEVLENGAWQIWSFGPVLLRDGELPSDFKAGIAIESPNPRSGVGYFEPGHYCFVAVDGRRPGYSTGMTFKQFAAIFQELGCECAYNLDGGGSTAMTLNGALADRPSGSGRSLSDILLIAEPPSEEAGEDGGDQE